MPDNPERGHEQGQDPGNMQEDDVHDGDADASRKTSVYLDASEDGAGPSVADILRELRELPEKPAAGTRTNADVLEDPLPTLGEVVARSSSLPNQSSIPSSRQPVPAEAIVDDSTVQILPPTLATRHRQSRGQRRSGIRHSFSSITAIKSGKPDLDLDRLGTRGSGADAVVELHEESAAAFQDFLFWAYPQ